MIIFHVLDDIADNYNKTFHITINVDVKLVDVKPDSYAEYNVDSNEKDLKFQVDDHLRIWKYKKSLAKGYTPNWSKEIF